MKIREIDESDKEKYNTVASHPLQSWEWGEFRRSNGALTERFGIYKGDELKSAFQVFFHSLPVSGFRVGYFPKGPMPIKLIVDKVRQTAQKNKAVFVKFEPNQQRCVWENQRGDVDPMKFKEKKVDLTKFGLRSSPKPIFDPYTFILNIKPDEDKLLAGMHAKTRYNIRLAQKKGVIVEEDNSPTALTIFLRLLFEETAKRQGFYMHSPSYFRKMWDFLQPAGIAHLFLAKFKSDVLSAWILFKWKDTLYYPYGASSDKYRNLMASNLICWEAIRWGKKNRCRLFDMWGALPPGTAETHPWYGFYRFKLGYGGDLVESVGSWDLVVSGSAYRFYQAADKLRWLWLRWKKQHR